MNTIVFVASVWGARVVRDFIEELVTGLFPDTEKKGLKILYKVIGLIVGWGVFFLDVYLSGSYIMPADANMPVSVAIAVVPMLLVYGYKLFTRSAVIEA